MRCLLTTVLFGSKLRRMKATILPILLLACGLAFGQKFQDVSAKGSPVSLGVKHDHADMGPYAAARNNSSKAILAIVASVQPTNTEASFRARPIWITPLKSACLLLRKNASLV